MNIILNGKKINFYTVAPYLQRIVYNIGKNKRTSDDDFIIKDLETIL